MGCLFFSASRRCFHSVKLALISVREEKSDITWMDALLGLLDKEEAQKITFLIAPITRNPKHENAYALCFLCSAHFFSLTLTRLHCSSISWLCFIFLRSNWWQRFLYALCTSHSARRKSRSMLKQFSIYCFSMNFALALPFTTVRPTDRGEKNLYAMQRKQQKNSNNIWRGRSWNEIQCQCDRVENYLWFKVRFTSVVIGSRISH